MINFRKLSVDDKNEFEPILKNSESFACDSSFSTMFLWKDVYNLRVFRYDDFILRAYEKDNKINSYAFPVGKGDRYTVCNEIFNDAKERNIPFAFICVPSEAKKFLEENFPGRFEFEEQRNSEDYIYLTENLINLNGKKYHGKRNHIAKFERLYKEYSFDILTPENMGDALDVCRKWCRLNGQEDFRAEYYAIESAFEHYDELDMFGGVLYVNGNAVAMTMGHPINDNVFDINFEKALTEYTGAYTMINREFAKHLSNYKYINREEDLGIEGLRKSKLSYYPEMLFKKYNAKMIG